VVKGRFLLESVKANNGGLYMGTPWQVSCQYPRDSRLGAFSDMFERYRVRSWKLRFQSTAALTVSGSLVVWADPDATAKQPDTLEDVQGAVAKSFYKEVKLTNSMVWDLPQTYFGAWKFTSPKDLNLTLTSYGVGGWATYGAPSTWTEPAAGRLEVEYEIEFSDVKSTGQEIDSGRGKFVGGIQAPTSAAQNVLDYITLSKLPDKCRLVTGPDGKKAVLVQPGATFNAKLTVVANVVDSSKLSQVNLEVTATTIFGTSLLTADSDHSGEGNPDPQNYTTGIAEGTTGSSADLVMAYSFINRTSEPAYIKFNLYANSYSLETGLNPIVLKIFSVVFELLPKLFNVVNNFISDHIEYQVRDGKPEPNQDWPTEAEYLTSFVARCTERGQARLDRMAETLPKLRYPAAASAH